MNEIPGFREVTPEPNSSLEYHMFAIKIIGVTLAIFSALSFFGALFLTHNNPLLYIFLFFAGSGLIQYKKSGMYWLIFPSLVSLVWISRGFNFLYIIILVTFIYVFAQRRLLR